MNHSKIKARQTGVATMVMSITLLVSVSLMSVYSAQVSVMNQRISSNQYRTTQAFEAAQAGIDSVFANLDMNVIQNALCTGSGTETDVNDICYSLPPASGSGSLASFSDADISLHSLSTKNQQTVGEYNVSFEKHADFENMVTLTITGYAGDNPMSAEGSKPNIRITQDLVKTGLMSNPPSVPLTSKTTIEIKSSTVIINESTSGNGKAFCANGSVKMEGDPDLSRANGSTSNSGEYDGMDNDTYFKYFFSESKEALKQRAIDNNAVLSCNECSASNIQSIIASSNDSDIIWIEGGIKINGAIDVGSAASPKIFIVEDDSLIEHSNAKFYGILYVMGQLEYDEGSITGAVVTEGHVKMDNDDEGITAVITYSDDVLSNLDRKFSQLTRVSGSWKDF